MPPLCGPASGLLGMLNPSCASLSATQMTKSLMPGLVYGCGVVLGTEKYARGVTMNMLLIAFGVVVCAYGEQNLVLRGLVQQLAALLFEVRPHLPVSVTFLCFNGKGLFKISVDSCVPRAVWLCLNTQRLASMRPQADGHLQPSLDLVTHRPARTAVGRAPYDGADPDQ